MQFVTATPDLKHVVVTSAVPLTGEESAPGLYEWTAGQLQLISVLPDGRSAERPRGTRLLQYGGRRSGADGSRAVWTSVEEEPKVGHLYMHDSANDQTLRLDAAEGVAEPKGTGSARFQSASSDGSRVFFY